MSIEEEKDIKTLLDSATPEEVSEAETAKMHRDVLQTIMPPGVVVVDGTIPNYSDPCTECEKLPTVVYFREGEVVDDSHLCAQCTWGDNADQYTKSWE